MCVLCALWISFRRHDFRQWFHCFFVSFIFDTGCLFWAVLAHEQYTRTYHVRGIFSVLLKTMNEPKISGSEIFLCHYHHQLHNIFCLFIYEVANRTLRLQFSVIFCAVHIDAEATNNSIAYFFALILFGAIEKNANQKCSTRADYSDSGDRDCGTERNCRNKFQ